jgi:hypothetical protein
MTRPGLLLVGLAVTGLALDAQRRLRRSRSHPSNLIPALRALRYGVPCLPAVSLPRTHYYDC